MEESRNVVLEFPIKIDRWQYCQIETWNERAVNWRAVRILQKLDLIKGGHLSNF